MVCAGQAVPAQSLFLHLALNLAILPINDSSLVFSQAPPGHVLVLH